MTFKQLLNEKTNINQLLFSYRGIEVVFIGDRAGTYAVVDVIEEKHAQDFGVYYVKFNIFQLLARYIEGEFQLLVILPKMNAENYDYIQGFFDMAHSDFTIVEDAKSKSSIYIEKYNHEIDLIGENLFEYDLDN